MRALTTSLRTLTARRTAVSPPGLGVGTHRNASPCVSDAQLPYAPPGGAVEYLESNENLQKTYLYAMRQHSGMHIRPMFELLIDHVCGEDRGCDIWWTE